MVKRKKGFYISKRGSYPMYDTKRYLVVVKGEKANTTPLNKMVKELNLKGNWNYSRSYGNAVILERYGKRKK